MKKYTAISSIFTILSILVILMSVALATPTISQGDKHKELLKDVKDIRHTISIENIDSNKEKILKDLDDSPIITEDWMSGTGRAIFIHRADAKTRKTHQQSGSACYKLMGVKWSKLPVNYVINPTNNEGLSETFIDSAISTAAGAWDGATSKKLYGIYTVNYSDISGILDNSNDIVFGYNPNTETIAITTVWRNIQKRAITEFDQQYNTYYTWGDVVKTGNTNLMDLQNIATHELGHGIGMGDIYAPSCSYVTMYGYSGPGDTQKRTLEKPDIAGVQKMYGP